MKCHASFETLEGNKAKSWRKKRQGGLERQRNAMQLPKQRERKRGWTKRTSRVKRTEGVEIVRI